MIKRKAMIYAILAAVFYAIAPFIGAMLSFVLVGETPGIGYFVALAFMLAGTAFAVWDTLKKEKNS